MVVFHNSFKKHLDCKIHNAYLAHTSLEYSPEDFKDGKDRRLSPPTEWLKISCWAKWKENKSYFSWTQPTPFAEHLRPLSLRKASQGHRAGRGRARGSVFLSRLLKAQSKDASLVGPLASFVQRSGGNSSKFLTIHLAGDSSQVRSASLSTATYCLCALQGVDFQPPRGAFS